MPGIEDEVVSAELQPLCENLFQFFTTQLEGFQPRDDYRQLLILALIFLSSRNDTEVYINAWGGPSIALVGWLK